MSDTERRLIAEQKKLDALRSRIREVTFLKTGEVRRHFQMSRATLYQIPMAVLPYTLTPGGERRYHPDDVAAYPARARRWMAAREKGAEDAFLAALAARLEERDGAALVYARRDSDAA